MVAKETLREAGRRLMLVLSMAVILRSNPDGWAIASATAVVLRGCKTRAISTRCAA
jgi:hypothetical protein